MRQQVQYATRAGLAFVLLLALTGMPANAGKGGNGGGHGGHGGGGGGSQDTTPPGALTDLAVASGEEGVATIPLTWTVPADDGYDVTTGAPEGYQVRVRTGSPFTTENWDAREARLNQVVSFDVQPDPGETVQHIVSFLAPNSHYWIGVRAVDDAGNLSELAQVEANTEPAPTTAWVAQDVDGCPANDLVFLWIVGLDFAPAPDGSPAILYIKNCDPRNAPTETRLFWAHAVDGVWGQPEQVADESGPLGSSDPRLESFAFAPDTGQPTLAHIVGNGQLQFYTYDGTDWSGEIVEKRQAGSLSLAYCGGVPTIAYKRGAAVRVAQKAGNHGDTTEFGLPTSQNTPYMFLDLACDGGGNPAVAFGQDRDGNASAEIVNVALWRSGGWQIETVAQAPPGGAGAAPHTLSWDPHRGDFTVAYDYFVDGTLISTPAGSVSAIALVITTGRAQIWMYMVRYIPHSPGPQCSHTTLLGPPALSMKVTDRCCG